MTSSPLRPWPIPSLTSSGDYTFDSSLLEQSIGGALYSKQSTLPNLPVPTLSDTLRLLKNSVKAQCKNEQEWKNVNAKIDAFEQEGGKTLQRRLEKRALDNPDSSWLQLWWNTLGYLQVRDPVPVNVSYFFQFSDDPTASTGIQRAASLLTSTALFRKSVCSGTLPCETIGKSSTPLCSAAWKYMFNACRIPNTSEDTYKIHDPSLHSHVVVLRNGVYLSFPFVDSNSDPLPCSVIESLLSVCVDVSDNSESEMPNIGVMTANDRDEWAEDRREIIRIKGGKEGLEIIGSAAILLCLDESSPVSYECSSNGFWHGGPKSGNRFFDKSIQLLVTENGKAGLLGEHSMMDGMPMVRYADFIATKSYADVVTQHPLPRDYPNGMMPSTQVTHVFDESTSRALSASKTINDRVARATIAFNKLVGDQDLNVQSFQGYGSSFMKSMKFSPDAYVQMAIQLATYRLFSTCVGTYEASQVRVFKHGRTETTRSCSVHSRMWCEEMGLRRDGKDDDTNERTKRVQMLRSAAKQHVNYLKSAGKGLGVDRHMFGLSMLVDKREDAPSLFSDEAYKRAKTWRVSTSHLTHPKFDNWGWGEVVPDGVGVAYSIHPNRCVFNVTARKDTGYSQRLAYLLEEALVEMRQLLEKEMLGGGEGRSKL
ncbi:hypothetical protein TrST_g7483 [Triparma strigata]|uniref:Choline/carnitine acyltransferase domain-containing protein n=1 Tax=Triparma strigata TaxID=1606541 RepID=A0A9W7AE81_9STRA|nr:hypothetical protein TrST_g7483 [Triparma strigata]